FRGNDYPRTWAIGKEVQEQVLTPFESSVHFNFRAEMANATWDSQFPRNGLIRLGAHQEIFSISMFHQLRCISLIRSDIFQLHSSNYTTAINPLSGHCLNYLRQMVLCRADIDLEHLTLIHIPITELQPNEHRCTNWKLIYQALLDNHRMYPNIK
ncbi:hypothetical protein HYPSUDRAFT_144239, partial [Hypholoma sublateritium FD-334 SS-4]